MTPASSSSQMSSKLWIALLTMWLALAEATVPLCATSPRQTPTFELDRLDDAGRWPHQVLNETCPRFLSFGVSPTGLGNRFTEVSKEVEQALCMLVLSS